MTDSDAHLLAQDGVEACNPDGTVNPVGLAVLVVGGLVFFVVFWIWVASSWVMGEFT